MDIIFRPDKNAGDIECCEVCNRAIGMTEGGNGNCPLMCVVCATRFNSKQWERDDKGYFFNLTKNGVDNWSDGKITALMDKKVNLDQ